MPEQITLNYPLTMPARPGFREVVWGMDSIVAVTESFLTFSQQVYAWPGQRWKCALKLPPMQVELAREWLGFFAALNGQEGTFLLSDSAFARRSVGDGLGHGEIYGAQPAGRVLLTRNWTPLMQVARTGDWLEIAGRLRRVLLPAYSDANGQAHLHIWPNTAALADGAPIEWLEPKGIFRLAAEVEILWDVNRMMSGLQFSAVEAIT